MTEADPNLAYRNLEDYSGMASDWFWETDAEHRFIYFSRRMEEVTRFKARALLGQKRDVIPNEDLSDPKWVKHMDDLKNYRPFRNFEYEMRRPHDGTLLWIRIAGEPQFDTSGGFLGYRGTGHDITPEKVSMQRLEASNIKLAERNKELDRAHQTIERIAHEDALTNLPNRRAFERDLKEALDQHDKALGLIHVDLDRFKWVNDTLGHPAGDEVLQTAATRLQTTVGAGLKVYRVGGDEFMVLLGHPIEMDDALYIGNAICAAMDEPIPLGAQRVNVRASVGIAVENTSRIDERRLINQADVALYEAKRSGRNTVFCSTPQMQARAEEARHLASDIPDAIERREFVPFFQPQIDASSGMVIGVEALVRWQHPERGLLAPDAFLRMATDLGKIDEIDRLMLETSLAAVNRLRNQGFALPSLSVNVSEARLADARLCDDIDLFWQDKRCKLAIELLETINFDEAGQSNQFDKNLARLRDMGVRIETDDFGSGRASITGLLRIQPDRIKIDRSLVQKVVGSAKQRSLVLAILDMAQALDIECIAEGVETQADIDALSELGCHRFQGFAICHPISEIDLAEFLASRTIAPLDTSKAFSDDLHDLSKIA